MLEVTPLNALPQNAVTAVPKADEIERKSERETRARGRVGQKADQRQAHALSSNGHAGPGGQKGQNLDVTG